MSHCKCVKSGRPIKGVAWQSCLLFVVVVVFCFFVCPFQVQGAGCKLAIIVHFAVKLLIRTHLLGDFISTDKYRASWLLLVSVDVILN